MQNSMLAEALFRIRAITKNNKANIIRSQQMNRSDRELMMRAKWLREIIKGWYLVQKPESFPEDSTPWYASFWDFLRLYLSYYYDEEYCLSAESSLDLHTGSTVIPKQVVIISSKGGGSSLELPFNTSIFVYRDPANIPQERTTIHGVNVMTLSYALCKVTKSYFQKNPQDAEIALQMVRSSSELTEVILKYNFQAAASRLIGGYEFLKSPIADELREDLIRMAWKIQSENPFSLEAPLLLTRAPSPYRARILSLWSGYRKKVISHFSSPPGISQKKESYLIQVEECYKRDAYNSLSIEGYEVDEQLIARVKNNEWNPEENPLDLEKRNALAARGYYEAFLEVKKSIVQVLEGSNSGEVIEKDLKRWYQSLFSPFVRASIIRQEDLAGYRKKQVYIRGSRHVPFPKEALVDAMEALFECLKNEEHPAVRAVLGHFVFVYIHPFMDGNGRLGRFLMNVLFLSGGYPWTIISVKNRTEYLNALECASAHQDIEPFARFVAKEMNT